MPVAEKLALLVTASEEPNPFVSTPVDASTRLPAVFAPASSIAESSAMLTLPAEVKVSEPKFIASPD